MAGHAVGRRAFLRTCGAVLGGVASLAGAGRSSAAVNASDYSDYDFLMPRVQYASDRRVAARWNVYPSADWVLLQEFSRAVRCKVKLPSGIRIGAEPNRTRYGNESMFNAVVDFKDEPELLRPFPFLFMTGEGAFSFSQAQEDCLRKYVEEGGFLFMDDCVYGLTHDYFYQSGRRMLNKVFGGGAVKPIQREHEIFHNVFDLRATGLPHPQGKNHGAQGVFVGDRLAVFLSSTDLHCAWADYFIGQWFSKQVNQACLQLGINVLLYAVTH